MYAGLRRGELMALRLEDLDSAAGVIYVRHGWDAVAGQIPTKSGKDRRVPIPTILRGHLDEHLLGAAGKDGLVFGVTADKPFNDTSMREHTRKAWGWRLDDQGGWSHQARANRRSIRSRCTSAGTPSHR
jgi:integrase